MRLRYWTQTKGVGLRLLTRSTREQEPEVPDKYHFSQSIPSTRKQALLSNDHGMCRSRNVELMTDRHLTLSLPMSYIYGAPRKARNLTSYIWTRFFTGDFVSRTVRKVAGSIPDGVIGIFHWHNPSGLTMALGLTQPLTKMSTRDISWG
jgi:hypothetical protein